MTLTDTQTPTLAYLTELKTTGRAPHTIANKRAVLKQLDAWLAGRPLTKELLHAYAQHVNASEGAPGAKREHIQVVRTFMYWSRMHGFHTISRDDIRDFTPQCKAAMRIEPTVLSRPAIKALYDVVAPMLTYSVAVKIVPVPYQPEEVPELVIPEGTTESQAATLRAAHKHAVRLVKRNRKANMQRWARAQARLANIHNKRMEAGACEAKKEASAASAILACLFTGCRAQEAQGITVNTDLGTITIIDKKRNQTRTMPVALFAGLPDIFSGPRRWSRAHWKQWCKAAGPLLAGCKVKDLRSTWRNYAVSSGMEAQDACGYQGHTRQVDESSYALRQRMPGVTGATVAAWFNLGSQGG